MRWNFLVIAVALLWVPAAAVHSSEAAGSYAEIADIKMYYEDHGSGQPLVFIHGGFGSSEMWAPYVRQLSTEHRVITLDSRGQGRSLDGNGPITYGRMANDVVRLLDHLGIDKAHVIGHSDGGCIILHMLVDYPDRVSSATLMGTPFHTNNYPPEVFAGLQQLVEALKRGEEDRIGFKLAYERRAPDPSYWPIMIDKLSSTWLSQPTFAPAELRNIRRPVLVVKVDQDQFLPPAVFDKTAELIPGAELFHIPEGTHRVPLDHPDQLAKAINSFVSAH